MTARRKAKLPGGVDWSFGPGTSPTMGAVNAGFATANAAAIGALLRANSAWGVVLGVAMAIASLVALGVDRHRLRTIQRAVIYRAGCWTGAGLWATVQLGHRPWSWTGVMVLAIGAGVSAIIGEALRAAEQRATPVVGPLDLAGPPPAALPEHVRTGLQWEALLRRICRIQGIEVLGCQIWPDGTGHTIEGCLPDDGSTVADVKAHTTELATAADLPPGCNVEVHGNLPGVSRRIFQVKVNTQYVLDVDQPFPDDPTPRTILDPVELGPAIDRTIGGVSLYQDSVAVVGQRGSGKSTCLNVITAGLGLCTDALILAIDTKGGGEFPRRWMQAAYEGRAERPVIALCANTDELALLMVEACISVATGRPTHYATLMRQQDAAFIQPTPTLPQLVLVIDEFKSLAPRVKERIEDLVDIGRSAGVQVVLCALKATSVGIPSSVLTQIRERVGLRFSDESEIQYLFDKTWRSGRFDPASMTEPGMELVMTNAQPPIQVKGYALAPSRIDELSVRLAPLRPGLDDASFAMFDTVTMRVRDDVAGWQDHTITGVWEYIRIASEAVMFADRVRQPAAASAVPGTVHTRPANAAVPPGRPDRDRSGSSAEEALADLADSGEELGRALDAARAAAEAADVENGPLPPASVPVSGPAAAPDPEFDAIVGRLGQVPPPRDRYRDLLIELGPTGATEISSRLRLEGYPTARQTVQGWLDEDQKAGRVGRTQEGWRWVGDAPR